MNLSIFISLVTILSSISSLFTQAIKKAFKVNNSTLLVLIISVIIGWGGGAMTYVFMHIPFNNVSNDCCLFLLAPAVWLCATLGYDKVMEVIRQIGVSKVAEIEE